MNKHMISYDLLAPGRDYTSLTKRLTELGATRVLLSQWILKHTASAEQVRDDLMRFIDSNDRLLVSVLTGEAAWSGLLITTEQFKQLAA